MASARGTVTGGDAAPGGHPTAGDLLVRRRAISDFDRGGSVARPAALPAALARALRPFSTVVRVESDANVAALTYDDGPDPEQTPALLDLLAENGIRCTFFVIVTQAEKHPEIIARMVAEGHEVALHGVDHRRLTTLSTRDAVTAVREGRERLQQLLQRPVALFRPPYGAQTFRQAVGFRGLGLEVVLWSGWARDWVHDEVPAIAERVVTPLRPGAVILLHDRRGDPELGDPAELPRFSRAEVLAHALGRLAERDTAWRFDTVGALLGRSPAVRTVWAEIPSPRALLRGGRG